MDHTSVYITDAVEKTIHTACIVLNRANGSGAVRAVGSLMVASPPLRMTSVIVVTYRVTVI